MDFKTRVYIADVSELRNRELYLAAYGMVSEERKKKTDRFIPLKSKLQSLGAELLLRKGLSDIGFEKEIKFRRSENGKPYIEGAEEINFNLSHSGDMAICAFSGSETGCDIEGIKEIDFDIAKRFFFASEYEAIMSQRTDAEKTDMFFRLWTLKESFMKITGLGMSLGLDAFEIKIAPRGIIVSQKVSDKNYFFNEYDVDGYKCAVCALYDGFEPELRRVKLNKLFP